MNFNIIIIKTLFLVSFNDVYLGNVLSLRFDTLIFNIVFHWPINLFDAYLGTYSFIRKLMKLCYSLIFTTIYIYILEG